MSSLKFTYETEVRRILLRENEEASLSYSKLLNHLLSLFPSLAGPLTGKIISLTYEDEDGDMITCSSDVELEEALRVMREEARMTGRKLTLRFGVKLLDDTSLPSVAASAAPKNFPSCSSVHSSVTCDECGVSPIVGARYKCAIRHDFDLCERCEAKKQQPYPMIKIVDPSQAPDILVFSLRDGQGRNEEGIHPAHHHRAWPRGFRGPPHPHHPHPHPHPFGHHHPPGPPPHHFGDGAVPPPPPHQAGGGCPMRGGGGGRGGGACRWRRKWEKWADDFVRDPAPVVAPFVAAMDSVVDSVVSNLSSVLGGGDNSNNNSSSSRNRNPEKKEQERGKETVDQTVDEEEEEKMLEEVLLREAAAAASAKDTSLIEEQLLEKALLESLTINSEGSTSSQVAEQQQLLSATVNNGKPEYVETSKPAVPTLPKPALRFVRDVTFPDGTVVQPGAIFRKVWRVRNDGNHSWPEGSSLVNVGGDILSLDGSTNSSEVLPSLTPDQEGELAVQLIAPEAPGMYTTYYRAQTKEKQYFGQRLWAAIVVADHSSSHNGWVNILDDKTLSSKSASPIPVPVSLASVPSSVAASSANNEAAVPVVSINKPVVNEREEEVAAAANTVVSVPVTVEANNNNEATQQSASTLPPAHLRSALLLWRRELSILNDMGFTDVETILPLLQQHFGSPLSLSADKNAVPNVEGMQAVVATLLSLQMDGANNNNNS